ncbi:MAG: type II toxin-antitoxin system VapC family toxin [Myxococcaceae bacterium]
MNVYLDSSVVLRKLLNEPNPIAEWEHIEEAYSSRLLFAEVGRVIDRLRLLGRITDEQVARLFEQVRELLSAIDVFSVTDAILERVAGPMATVVGTLDAVHLVTAQELWREKRALVFATHDERLSRAARAGGMKVIGVNLES